MGKIVTRLSVVFTAGVVGAIVNSLAVQLILGLIKPEAAPEATKEWVFSRLVWGGVWGLLLLLPLLPRRPVLRGLIFSIPPTVARFTIFATPGPVVAPMIIFTIFFNIIWGITAALWERAAEAPQLQRR